MTTWVLTTGGKHPQIKVEIWHVKLPIIVSFHIQWAGAQSQTSRTCVTFRCLLFFSFFFSTLSSCENLHSFNSQFWVFCSCIIHLLKSWRHQRQQPWALHWTDSAEDGYWDWLNMRKIPDGRAHVGTEKTARVGFLFLSRLPSSEQSNGCRSRVMSYFLRGVSHISCTLWTPLWVK